MIQRFFLSTTIIAATMLSPAAGALITIEGDVEPLVGPGDVNLGANTLWIGSNSSTAAGSVSAQDATIVANSIFLGGSRGGAGTLTLRNTTVTLTDFDNDGENFDIGGDGIGVVRILDGSIVDAGFTGGGCDIAFCGTFVANAAGSHGTVEIAGNGSSLNATHLLLGGLGIANEFDFGTVGGTSIGTVLVSDSATLAATTTSIGMDGADVPQGDGTEHSFGIARVTRSATWATDVTTIGVGVRSHGLLSVDQGGIYSSEILSLGNGQVTVEDGGVVQSNQLFIGSNFPGGVGTVEAAGIGAHLQSVGDDAFIAVGFTSSGHLELRDGAVASTGSLSAGFFAEGDGTILIEGSGTQVNLSGVCVDCASVLLPEGSGASLVVAAGGLGAATIRKGATVTIDGTGSTQRHGVFVGIGGVSAINFSTSAGIGSLLLEDAGTAVSVIGDQSSFDVGTNASAGSVIIASGAQVTLDNTNDNAQARIGSDDGNGSLIVSGAGSLLDAGAEFVGGNVDNSAGGAAIIVIEDGGELRANTITFNQGTIVSGNGGTLTGSVLNHGTILPGSSPGVMNIEGDFTLFDDSTLVIEIAGTDPGTDYDVFNVSGTATLNGTLQIVLLGGFEPEIADAFDFLNAASVLGQFDQVIAPIVNGRTLAFDGFGQLAVTAVPVPPALGLMFGPLLTLFVRRACT